MPEAVAKVNKWASAQKKFSGVVSTDPWSCQSRPFAVERMKQAKQIAVAKRPRTSESRTVIETAINHCLVVEGIDGA